MNLADIFGVGIRGVSFGNIVYDILYRLINKVTFYKSLDVLHLNQKNLKKEFQTLPEGYFGRFTEKNELLKYCNDPQYGLSEEFLEDAFKKGDKCYGVFKNDIKGSKLNISSVIQLPEGEPRLVTYGWFSRSPTSINKSISYSVAENSILMYKGLTICSERGLRLNSIGKCRSLTELFELHGVQEAYVYTERNNYRSKRSICRLGFQPIGRVVIIRVFIRLFIFYFPRKLKERFLIKLSDKSC